MRSFQEFKGHRTRLDYDRERGEFVASPAPHQFVIRNATSNRAMELTTQRNAARDEPLARYEDSVWTRAVVGLALAGIVIWVGFVVS